MILQWETWHINKDLMAHLRAIKTKETKQLFRKLDTREFFSNALSFLFSLFVLLTIVILISFFSGSYIYPEEYFYPFVTIALAILSIWGSEKLKKSASNLLMEYLKKPESRALIESMNKSKKEAEINIPDDNSRMLY